MNPSSEVIGKGLTSVVYIAGEGKVIKLFESWVAEPKVRREFAITRALHGAGVPVPAVYEIAERDGRLGIVFERIDGISLFRSVQARPWRLFSAARQLAELHAQLHGVTAPAELPTQRDQLAGWIDASDYSPEQKKADTRPTRAIAIRRCGVSWRFSSGEYPAEPARADHHRLDRRDARASRR